MFGRSKATTNDAAPMAAPGGARPAGAGAKSAADGGYEHEQLWEPVQAPRQKKSVEQLLLERGQITEEQLDQARKVQSQTPSKTVPQVLLTMNACTENHILSAQAEMMGVPYESPAKNEVDPQAFALLPQEYIKKQGVIPLRFEGSDGSAKVLVVGMSDPNNVFLYDEVRRRLKRETRYVAVSNADIIKLVELMTMGNESTEKVDEILKDVKEDDVQVVKEEADSATDLEKAGNESPIIRFVNYLIADAIKQGASDIHIEPKEKALKIRLRIDGILFEAMNPPHTMTAAIVSRLKIMSNLDISERRLPQDGRIRAIVNDRKIDLRMSTLPTAFGEKVVMRILDNKAINVPLEALGFSDEMLAKWKEQIDQPHGIVLVTGPTGSGKTTTLYSSLRVMDGNKLNISTVEDPIEYQLASANQVQVHEKIGMTFSAALRSLLRQDPDVVLLGEIRDAETARIAVQAALTGHLVLSTLHTNDAPSSVTRLINIGVEPYLISSAVNAIVAQRLVRKICKECKEEYEPSAEHRAFLTQQGFTDEKIMRGKGCDRCRKTGYAGRLGIYELLIMDDQLRDMVTANPDVIQLRRKCREKGLITLREDGFGKVRAGLTTIDEILRVTEKE
jgi:type IV pilus assembly protein PilB